MNRRTEEMLCKQIDDLDQEFIRLNDDFKIRLTPQQQKEQERKNKLLEERRQRHELMWAKQREAREKALKLKAKNESQKIDRYRKMEFSVLLKEYLALYFVVKICLKGNSDDSHLLKLAGLEVSEFRSQSEQAELKNNVERLKRLSATLFKNSWLCIAFKKVISWISGGHQ